ncbi:Sesquiterpene synthase 2 [Linum perenne]
MYIQIVRNWNEQIEELKSEVKRRLSSSSPATADHHTLFEMLNLINVIERLGIDYHFEVEIELFLQQLYAEHNSVDNLRTAALSFRLLRQHGYNISTDAFKKYKTEQGGFKIEKIETAGDIEGILNLYEAAYLRVEGDDILDEAIEFTESILGAKVDELEPSLAERVNHALERPLRKGVERTEHLFFISVYETIPGHDSTLLKLAKLSFNVVQNLYQKELRVLSKWWAEMDLPRKLPHARDKLIEVFFWAIGGALWKPKYSKARYFFTKVTSVGSMVDDTYDAYGTRDELEVLTDAIQRWDTSMKDVEDRMKILFAAVISIYDEIDSFNSNDGKFYCMDFGKQALKLVAKFYMEEVRWFAQSYVPTIEEYRQVSSLSTIYQWMTYSALCGMGDAVTKEAFDWLFSTPPMLVASSDHCRLLDDVVSHEFEQKRGHAPSSVQCYMKQHGVGKEEAVDALRSLAEEDWKVMNKELLMFSPPASCGHKEAVSILTGLAQVMEVLYKKFDGYTNSNTSTRDMLTALFVTPLPI